MSHDDLGTAFTARAPARRVVSLVPSITESLADVRAEALVGVTDWCTRPVDLACARIRGTKNPDLQGIERLRPDLVIANKEENRRIDVERLRARGVPVWVTDIESVPDAIRSLERLFDHALRWPRPDWLGRARELWCGDRLPPVTRRVVVPIWRDPWMVVGSRTFTGDLLRRRGWENVWALETHNPEQKRYPHSTAEAIDSAGADVVLLPDEPYVFTPEDGPSSFVRTPTELVSGRLLTWYGPSLVPAWSSLER
ncbi:helical backbone metal receptor [Nocardiopsis sp. ATB16-24]|uniref:helical backbone metal receptor n=1 Tax=Nocardiopsis sp. ATB16-24 TaxID=3019555 RepID=UPI002555817A|nr:helical backbone metal receptor [Nocardiopsis sp. ATB16-24]